MTKKLYISETNNANQNFTLAFLFLCFFGTINNSWGQVIELFSENMGTALGSGDPTPAQHDSSLRFQNSANYAFTGSSDVRNTDASSGYTDSSSSNNVMINSLGENLIIDGFELSEYKNIMLYFGLRVGAASATSAHFKAYYSTTGAGGTWIEIPIDISGPYSWRIVSTTTASYVPNDATALKFERTSTGTGGWVFRLDDILLTGELDCDLPSTPAGTVAAVGTAPFCGSSISFTYSGAAAPAGIAYYWQTASTAESTSFPLTSNPTFTINGTGTRTAYLKARRTDGGCWSSGNKNASGTVYTIPGITVQPVNRFIAPNANTTFGAATSGTVTSRQWQVSTDNGGAWENLTNAAPYSGATTATLAITNATAALHQNQYRMVASNNGCSTETNAVVLSITGIPAITTQPAIVYTSCNSATIALTALNVLGTTADLNYTWYAYRNATNDWSVITNSVLYDGATTATLIINSLADLNNTQYYVRVNYKNQTCYSASRAVKVTVTASTARWDGTSWSAAPDQDTVVILDDDYDTATANLTACSIDLNGNTLTINKDEFVQVQGNITGIGTIDIKDSGSLVQVEDGVDNGTQWTMNMERNTQKVFRYDFTYWGSPLTLESAFTLKELSTMTLFDKYYQWNATTGSWTTLAYGTQNMVPGRGYIVRAPQNYDIEGAADAEAQTFNANFTGLPNNGIVTQDVVGDNVTNKWNLLSNPYPSALDIEAFLEDNQAFLDGTIYLWTHNNRIVPTVPGDDDVYSYNPSDYASYNFSGPVATRGQSALSEDNPAEDTDINNNVPTQFLAAGQAFFVKGLSGGEVTFSNLYRGGTNNNFFRPAPTTPIDNWEMSGKHRVWLNLTGTDAFNQILVGYVENATNDLDWGYDGAQFGGNKVTLYSILDNNNLVIQGRALPFNNQDEVPLGYKTTLTGTLTISIDHYDGFFEGQDVYMEDKLLDVIHNLKQADYSFAAVPGTFNERFVLRFQPSEELGTPDQELANGLLVYRDNGGIRIKSDLQDLEQVTVYDLLGRAVFEKKAVGGNELAIENVVMNEQPLIVKVQLADGAVVSRKIVY